MPMTTFHVLFALFAAYMLFRHLPAARALLAKDPRARAGALVSAVNVLLALAILVIAMKGIVGALISRYGSR